MLVQSEKRCHLRGPRINDLRLANGKVTLESLHSGTQNSFSTASLGFLIYGSKISAFGARFGIRKHNGARSSEWVVMWKTNTSDVYLATRTLGGIMKASLNESGRCHVRAPDPQKWCGVGEPPRFLDVWNIDISADYQFPLAVVTPERELRQGEWAQHRDKGTIWIEAAPGRGVEIAIFFVRANGDLLSSLEASGWRTVIVDTSVPDGRRLIVVVGDAAIPDTKLAELESARLTARVALANSSTVILNPRMLLSGPNEQGTRKFVEAAVHQ